MLRVLPSGNLFVHANPEEALNDTRKLRTGLGSFQLWNDPQLVEWMNCLEPSDLVSLGSTSRVFYLFTLLEEPWERWGHDNIRSITQWQSSWRATVLRLTVDRPENKKNHILCNGDVARSTMYSDVLYHRMVRVASQGLSWGEGYANMTRRRYSDMTLDEFTAQFDEIGRPLLIEGMPWGTGDSSLLDENVDVICGHVTMSCKAYKEYCRVLGPNTEAPIFIFDEFIDTKFPRLAEQCGEMPFGIKDVLAQLPADLQPRKRWVLYGPARSHSKWHVDPNKSMAINGVLHGSKRWFMCPPHCVPPGVIPSADGSEVTQPVTLHEWCLQFYDEFWTMYGPDGLNVLVSDVCAAGEMVVVPRGWWHCVFNLEETLAVTWNFVTKFGQESTLRFFQTKFDQIFGVHRDKRADMVTAFENLVTGSERQDTEANSFWDRCRRKPLVYKRAG